MNKEDILEILEKFETSSAVSLSYKVGDSKFTVKKAEAFISNSVAVAAPVAPVSSVVTTSAAPQVEVAQTTTQSADANLVEVKSPIVGTFYRQPSPDAHPFVQEGQAIKAGDTLCILEAMKMLNPLEAEVAGTIEKILVNSGDLVEFDQPLFLVRV